MPSDPQLSQAVQGFLSQMWQHVDNTVRAMIGHHHEQHEAGGRDQVLIPVHALADVRALEPVTGNTLIYHRRKDVYGGLEDDERRDGYWQAETATGTAKHQAHLGLILPASTTPPGPTNITGAAYTVRAVRIASDGACSGSLNGCGFYSFSFGGGGGVLSYTNRSDTWGNGTTIGLSITSQGGDGSYLTVDLALE